MLTHRDLNDSYVEDELGIRYMATTLDPFDNRTMFKGEVGCFLSHHAIWKKVRICRVSCM